MKPIVIMGAGGFARELMALIEEIGGWKIMGFVHSDPHGEISLLHGYPNYPSLEIFKREHAIIEGVYYCFGAGSPKVKRAMDAEARNAGLIPATPLVHPNVRIHPSVQLADNVVICAGTSLTVDIQIGYGTMLNLHCTVGHDTVIGEYCTCSPGVHLSGNVTVENSVECGTNSTVIPYVTLAEYCVLGAGAVAVKSIQPGVVAVGVPAKPIG